MRVWYNIFIIYDIYLIFLQFINNEPKIPIKGGKIIPYYAMYGDVEFEHVNFSYPTRAGQVHCSLELFGQAWRFLFAN